MVEYNGKKYKGSIAVDYDGTLTIGEAEYPYGGELNIRLIEALKHLQRDNWLIILWTAREDWKLNIALDRLRRAGFIPDLVNSNIPSEVSKWGDHRKVVADYYIDDRMMTIEQCCTMGEAVYEATKDSQ